MEKAAHISTLHIVLERTGGTSSVSARGSACKHSRKWWQLSKDTEGRGGEVLRIGAEIRARKRPGGWRGDMRG